tara:strand:+ start:1290 stop:3044 length:1755 start_codon:yes stop_codon:yes gene_type:complete
MKNTKKNVKGGWSVDKQLGQVHQFVCWIAYYLLENYRDKPGEYEKKNIKQRINYVKSLLKDSDSENKINNEIGVIYDMCTSSANSNGWESICSDTFKLITELEDSLKGQDDLDNKYVADIDLLKNYQACSKPTSVFSDNKCYKFKTYDEYKKKCIGKTSSKCSEWGNEDSGLVIPPEISSSMEKTRVGGNIVTKFFGKRKSLEGEAQSPPEVTKGAAEDSSTICNVDNNLQCFIAGSVIPDAQKIYKKDRAENSSVSKIIDAIMHLEKKSSLSEHEKLWLNKAKNKSIAGQFLDNHEGNKSINHAMISSLYSDDTFINEVDISLKNTEQKISGNYMEDIESFLFSKNGPFYFKRKQSGGGELGELELRIIELEKKVKECCENHLIPILRNSIRKRLIDADTARDKDDKCTYWKILGHICHTIHDSYSTSHVNRDENGEIFELYDFSKQLKSRKWGMGTGHVLADNFSTVIGMDTSEKSLYQLYYKFFLKKPSMVTTVAVSARRKATCMRGNCSWLTRNKIYFVLALYYTIYVIKQMEESRTNPQFSGVRRYKCKRITKKCIKKNRKMSVRKSYNKKKTKTIKHK